MARQLSANIKASTAHVRTKRAAAETQESVNDIKSDMRTLKERLENLASAGSSEGLASAQKVFASLQSRFENFMDTDFAEQLGVNAAMEKGREKAEQARTTIQDKPLQSVLIAAGVGALVGFLLRR
ncbi:MAG: hypothetical protein DI585_02745 [Pseudomonas fluorescens]|nr:MAG: hypothetical protein DI585_02745 [Pseudomonas fluorescens]